MLSSKANFREKIQCCRYGFLTGLYGYTVLSTTFQICEEKIMRRWRLKLLTAVSVSVLAVLSLLSTGFAGTLSSPLLARAEQGGTILSGAPTYDWWYGCSPTSAGMMVGYYDRKGYGGLSYSNLVRGGVAESTTFGISAWSALAQSAIASSGHVSHYYVSGYDASGDDLAGRTVAEYDSLADFMGTSQDSYGNRNGMTTFFYYTDGSAFTAKDSLDYGIQDKDGAYGIWEYLNYAGYAVPLSSVYTQHIFGEDYANGFTFADYKAEIDAGRVVMIQVTGHSMFGYGYGDNDTVYFYNTWDDQEHTMTWGGTYSEMDQWGVVCFTPEGGSAVPLPPSILLFGFGFAGIGWCGRFRRK
jgi:hypothetical protein